METTSTRSKKSLFSSVMETLFFDIKTLFTVAAKWTGLSSNSYNTSITPYPMFAYNTPQTALGTAQAAHERAYEAPATIDATHALEKVQRTHTHTLNRLETQHQKHTAQQEAFAAEAHETRTAFDKKNTALETTQSQLSDKITNIEAQHHTLAHKHEDTSALALQNRQEIEALKKQRSTTTNTPNPYIVSALQDQHEQLINTQHALSALESYSHQVDNRVAELEEASRQYARKNSELNSRTSTLESSIADVASDLDRLDDRVDQQFFMLTGRQSALEHRVAQHDQTIQRHSQMMADHNTSFEAINKTLDKLLEDHAATIKEIDSKNISANEAINELREQLADLSQTLFTNTSDISEINGELDNIFDSVGKICPVIDRNFEVAEKVTKSIVMDLLSLQEQINDLAATGTAEKESKELLQSKIEEIHNVTRVFLENSLHNVTEKEDTVKQQNELRSEIERSNAEKTNQKSHNRYSYDTIKDILPSEHQSLSDSDLQLLATFINNSIEEQKEVTSHDITPEECKDLITTLLTLDKNVKSAIELFKRPNLQTPLSNLAYIKEHNKKPNEEHHIEFEKARSFFESKQPPSNTLKQEQEEEQKEAAEGLEEKKETVLDTNTTQEEHKEITEGQVWKMAQRLNSQKTSNSYIGRLGKQNTTHFSRSAL